MPKYTAFLFAEPDGSYLARVPILPDCTATGPTRAEALERAADAATAALLERGFTDRAAAPREEWSPSRTIWVRDPRTGNDVPYVAMVTSQPDGDKPFLATAVLFPEVQAAGRTIDDALAVLAPRVLRHLTKLARENRDFPVQDDASAYVIDVALPDRGGSATGSPGVETATQP